MDSNLARYIKSLSPNNSLGNYPNNISTNDNKYLFIRVFKTVVNNRNCLNKLWKTHMMEYYAAFKKLCSQKKNKDCALKNVQGLKNAHGNMIKEPKKEWIYVFL